MNQKLTLSIDSEAVERGKRYAASNGTSLSKLVESFLLLLDADGEVLDQIPVSQNLQSLIGIGAGAFDEDDYLEYLERKNV